MDLPGEVLWTFIAVDPCKCVLNDVFPYKFKVFAFKTILWNRYRIFLHRLVSMNLNGSAERAKALTERAA